MGKYFEWLLNEENLRMIVRNKIPNYAIILEINKKLREKKTEKNLK